MPRPKAFQSPIFIAAMALWIAASGDVFAQDATPPSPERLEAVQSELDRALTDAQALQSAAKQLDADIRNLREEASKSVARLRAQEQKLLDLDRQIKALEAEEKELSVALQQKDNALIELLEPLQRMAVQPPEALLFQPVPLSDTVKAAILLKSASAPLSQEVANLAADLEALYVLRNTIQQDRAAAETTKASIEADQSDLERLLAELREKRLDIGEEAKRTQDRALSLADQADDLRGLLTALAEAAIASKPDAPPPRPVINAPPSDIVLARRPEPPVTRVPFTQLQGRLPYPVVGELSDRYGDETDGGTLSKGIRIKTRPQTPVIAPHDGQVVFAGPFRGYGRILIIQYSEGFHTLLAGLGRLDAVTGQDVLAGEPVGVMDNAPTASLYVEVRRDGRPINPMPWLTAEKGSTSG